MRFLSKFLFSFFLFSTCFGNPFIPINTCPNTFSIEGEWIFFSVPSESKHYALVSDTVGTTSGVRRSIELDDFYSGYRAAIAYSLCNCNRYASVTWTSYKAQNSDVFQGPANSVILVDFPTPFGTLAQGSFATGSRHFNYYAVDGIFGQRILCDCCINLDLIAGVHYAHFLSRTADFANDSSVAGFGFNVEERADFWGLGPEIGIHGLAPLKCGLSFVGDLATSLIVGRPRTEYVVFSESNGTLGTPFSFRDQRTWQLVPAIDVSLGFNYEFCFPCKMRWLNRCIPSQCGGSLPREIRGSIEVGYETLCYFNALSTIEVPGSALAISFDIQRNVTLHGPYGAISINF